MDFDRAEPQDIKWWRKVNYVLAAMQRDDELQLIRASFDFHLAHLSNPVFNQEQKDYLETKKRLEREFHELTNMLRPWASRTQEEIEKDSLQAVIQQYKGVFGDPNDPKLLESIEKYTQYRQQRRRDRLLGLVDEAPEDRVTRLLRERARQRQGST